MKASVAAGVVLFNPEDINRVQQCTAAILEQTDHVYVFNNGTVDVPLAEDARITYLSENANKGIAYALNRIMECAMKDGHEWVLTMDQDSIVPDGMVDDFRRLIEKDRDKTAIFCPQVIDKRRAYMKTADDNNVIKITKCITSSSCTSTKAWECVGGFDEWLFIDLVDDDFCRRLIASGYTIKRANKWVLDQEFGKIVPKSSRKQQFWIGLSNLLHNKNIAKFSYNKYVSPLRVYYTNRNIIYVNRKLKKYGPVGYINYNCKGYLGFIFCFNLPSLLRARHKGQVLSAIIKGTRAGLKTYPSQWVAPTITEAAKEHNE